MSKAYYSTTIDVPATDVWAKIRDFNEDTWSGEVSKSWSESDMSGTEVGNIRVIQVGDKQLRQRLLAYSETDRFYTYEFAGAPSMKVKNFQATIHVLSVVDGNRAFVEWYATYDCTEEERQNSHDFFVQGCERWLEALRSKLNGHS
jgi:hypothetical protein